ncbi:cytochrome P450 [Streptomyces justiciae]|uniref:Cytochrome P450 n=1 Tax=Streptomyces justiciae TaxID=2780140 RepID=A0ABU3LW83_9ACTN|nr:cytochrome P450 [Streptomyces justiciae]MDT7843403.1 cytochrome P450 [Streptomyces justiciae]
MTTTETEKHAGLLPAETSAYGVTPRPFDRTVLSDPRFSSRWDIRHSATRRMLSEEPEPAEPGLFIGMDPPQHSPYRKLVGSQFGARRLNRLRPRIEEIVADRLDEMERVGPPVDLVSEFALPIPLSVVLELLGVPDSERSSLQRNTASLLSLTVPTDEMLAARHAIKDLIRRLVAAKRAAPTDDVLGGLVANSDLDDDELTGIGFLLLLAGYESTAHMLGLGTFALLRHPEQLAALRQNPHLIDTAVEELLRYLTVVQFGLHRTALEDVQLNGQLIKAGQAVMVSLTAANRDPHRFDDPDRLDLSRTPGGQVAFGYGVHQCLGRQLARTEMRVAFLALLRRFPTLRLAVPPQDVPM